MRSAGGAGLLLVLLTARVTNAVPLALPQAGFPGKAVPQGFGLGNSGALLTGGVKTALESVPAQVGKAFAKSAEKLGENGSHGFPDSGEDDDDDDDDDDDGDEAVGSQIEGNGLETEAGANDGGSSGGRDASVNGDPGLATVDRGKDGITAPAPTSEEPQARPETLTNPATPNLTRRAKRPSELLGSAGKAVVARRARGGGLENLLSNLLSSVPVVDTLQNLSQKQDNKNKDKPSPTSSVSPPVNSTTVAKTSETPIATGAVNVTAETNTTAVTPAAVEATPTTTATTVDSDFNAPNRKAAAPASVKKRGDLSSRGGNSLPVKGLPLAGLIPFSELGPITSKIIQAENQAASKRDLVPAVPLDDPFQILEHTFNEFAPDSLPVPGLKEFTIKKSARPSRRGLLPPIGLDKVGLEDGISVQDIAPPDLPLPGLTPKPEEEKAAKKPEKPTKTPEKTEEELDDLDEELGRLGKAIENKIEKSKAPKEDKEKAELDPTFGLDQVKKLGEQANLDNLGVSGLLANVADAKGLTS